MGPAKAAASEKARRTFVLYVEPESDARTQAGAIFNRRYAYRSSSHGNAVFE